jgi:Asp-tRNA(Asn)/Glu-tRNA(Gln) amidotransferase A subunit family amidase
VQADSWSDSCYFEYNSHEKATTMLKRNALADSINYASLMEVSGLLAREELSPVALTEKMLSRIDALNPALNAYLLVTHDSAGRGCDSGSRDRCWTLAWTAARSADQPQGPI